MNHVPFIPQYRPFGEPAFGNIVVLNTGQVGDTVTIDGDVYTFGGVSGNAFFGTDPLRTAQSLCAAIQSNLALSHQNVAKTPIRPYTAYYYQNTVVVVACAPGVAGNTLAMSTNNNATYTVPATLGGGVTTSISVDTNGPSSVVGFASVETASTGTNFTQLASNVCGNVTIYNNAGTDLEFNRANTGAAFVLANGFGKQFPVLTNSNELWIKRVDSSNTRVTVTFEYTD